MHITMVWLIALKKLPKIKVYQLSTKVFYSLNSGTVSPLIGIGFQASAMFFSYQACKRYFNQFK
jgi:hypothetical protein